MKSKLPNPETYDMPVFRYIKFNPKVYPGNGTPFPGERDERGITETLYYKHNIGLNGKDEWMWSKDKFLNCKLSGLTEYGESGKLIYSARGLETIKQNTEL